MARNRTLNKVSPVMVGEVVQRERLLQLLDGAPNGRAFWLVGPGGSGKTTLIAGLLARDKWPCLWYRVDALDGDPATFFYYLGQAATPLLDGNHPLPLLSGEQAGGVEAFTLRYFEQLFERVHHPCWLVFDNIQDAQDEQGLTKLLAVVLQQLPAHCNLAMLSRTDPPPHLARFLADRRLTLLAWPRFAFTFEELRAFFNLTEKACNDDELRELHQSTRGWIAGAVLWSLHSGELPAVRSAGGGGSPQKIFDFFMTEVLEKAEARQRAYLLRTAIMPSFTMSMAAALLETTEAEVEELVLRRGFFVERCHNLFDSFTYHPLFRAFLLQRVERTFEATALRALRSRAAEILEREGQIEDAAVLYQQAGEFRALLGLILGHARDLVAQGRCAVVTAWVDVLPARYLDDSPWLLYWKGVAHVAIDPSQGSRWCAEAFERFKAEGDLVGQVCSWSTVVNLVIVARRGFVGLDRWIAEGQRLDGQLTEVELPDAYFAQFSGGMLLALLLRDLDHPHLETWRQRCEVLFRDCADDHIALELMKNLWWSYFWLGRTPCKPMVADRLHQYRSQVGLAPFLTLLVRVLLAQSAASRGDNEACQQLVVEGLRQGQQSGIALFDVMLETFSGYGWLADGDLRQLPALLQRIRALLPSYAVWDQASTCYLGAWYLLELGDVAESERQIGAALDLVVPCGNPFTIALCQHLQAMVCLERGDMEGARTWLALVGGATWLARSPILMAFFDLAVAESGWRGDADEAAAARYRSAFATLHDEEYWVPFGFTRERLAKSCNHALMVGVEGAAVAEMIHRRRLHPPADEVVSELWPWVVRIETLGRFTIVSQRKRLVLSAKTPKKLLELLTLLICGGGDGIPREKITDILWPDSDADLSQQALHTAVHRLRKLLRQSEAVVADGHRLYLNSKLCYTDCHHFLALARELNLGHVSLEDRKRVIACFRLYGGAFTTGHELLSLALDFARIVKRSWHRALGVAMMLTLRQPFDQEVEFRLESALVDDETAAETLKTIFIESLRRQSRDGAVATISQCCQFFKQRAIGFGPKGRALLSDLCLA